MRPDPRLNNRWQFERPKTACRVNGIFLWGAGSFPAQLVGSITLGVQAITRRLQWTPGLTTELWILRKRPAPFKRSEIDLCITNLGLGTHTGYMGDSVSLIRLVSTEGDG